jgi:hypothetical protein
MKRPGLFCQLQAEETFLFVIEVTTPGKRMYNLMLRVIRSIRLLTGCQCYVSLGFVCIWLSGTPLAAQTNYPDSGRVVLIVESVPTGATVTIDSVVQGITPWHKVIPTQTFHLLSLELKEYLPFQRWIRRGVIDTLKLTFRLIPNWAWIRWSVSPTRGEFRIDGVAQKENEGQFLRLSTGIHTLLVSDSIEGRWIERKVDLKPADTISVQTSLGARALLPVVLSALLPGAGQIYDRSAFTGISFLVACATSFYLTSRAVADHDHAVSEYYRSLTLYGLAETESDASALKIRTQENLANANTLARRANTLTALSIAVYAANIVEALLNHAKDDYLETSRVKTGGKVTPTLSGDTRNPRVGISFQF